MSEYKPLEEDLLYAKRVNDKLVSTGVYDPIEIKLAYKRLFGEEAPNQHFARSRVFTYFQYNKIDITETNINESEALSIDVNFSSHEEVLANISETDNQEVIDLSDDLDIAKPKRKSKSNKK